MKIIDIVANYKNKTTLITELLNNGEDIDFFYDIPEPFDGELFLIFNKLDDVHNIKNHVDGFSKISSIYEYWIGENIKYLTSHCTALQMSLSLKDYETAQFLINNGANPLKMNKQFIAKQLKKNETYCEKFIPFCINNNLFDNLSKEDVFEFVNYFLLNGSIYINKKQDYIISNVNKLIQHFFYTAKIDASSFEKIILTANYCEDVYAVIKSEVQKNNMNKYFKIHNVKQGIKI